MTLLSVEDAKAHILQGVEPLDVEEAGLLDACGRVLARSVAARLTQPPFDASAMDGYAVVGRDVVRLPVDLKVIGESAAGRGFNGPIGPGECVRIFTGAPVPDGADAIVIQENVSASGDTIRVNEGQPDTAHIRKRGGDFRKGDALLSTGCGLSARDITLAASMGYSRLPVYRKPVVAILATGDELVEPGVTPGQDQIIASNAYGIAGMVSAAGGQALVLGIAKDTKASLEEKIDEASGADVLVTIGGASVGDHDLVGPVLKSRGLTLNFWKIAMRPGKPLLFGRLGPQRVLGVPGNPVSSLICARVFLVPLVRSLIGLLPEGDDVWRTAWLTRAVGANRARTHYMRAVMELDDTGGAQVAPITSQDSALLAPLAKSNCLIVRAPNAPEAKVGENVTVLTLDF